MTLMLGQRRLQFVHQHTLLVIGDSVTQNRDIEGFALALDENGLRRE